MAIALGDVEEVDAGLGGVAAEVDDFDGGPVGGAGDFFGFLAVDVVVEAGLAAEVVGFDPGAEAVFGVGLEGDVGVEAGVGAGGGDAADGFGAAVEPVGEVDGGPGGAGGAFFLVVVAAFPALGEAVGAGHFEARIWQEVRTFLESFGAVFADEEAGGVAEPFIGLAGGFGGELLDEGLEFGGGGEFGEFGPSGEAGGEVGVVDDAGSEVAGEGGGVAAEGADGGAAEAGVFGVEGGGEGGFVEGVEALEGGEGVEGADGAVVGGDDFFEGVGWGGGLAFDEEALGVEAALLDGAGEGGEQGGGIA